MWRLGDRIHELVDHVEHIYLDMQELPVAFCFHFSSQTFYSLSIGHESSLAPAVEENILVHCSHQKTPTRSATSTRFCLLSRFHWKTRSVDRQTGAHCSFVTAVITVQNPQFRMLTKGVPAEKIIIGLSSGGRSYRVSCRPTQSFSLGPEQIEAP